MARNTYLTPGMQIVAGALVLAALSFMPIGDAHRLLAQGAGGGSEQPYGGMRVFTLICTCSGNSLLYIHDYVRNEVMALLYQPGSSRLYLNYNIFGTYLLGSFRQDGQQCRIYVGKSCVTISSDGELGNQPGSGTSAAKPAKNLIGYRERNAACAAL